MSQRLRASKSLALTFGCVLAARVLAGPIIVSDTNFNTSDWSHSILWSRPNVSLGPMTQQLTGGCGDDGAYQQGRHTAQGSFGNISASLIDGHLFVGAGTYNPGTQGAITNLDVSYCFKNIAGTPEQDGLLIVQGARTFVYLVDSSPQPNWTTLGVNGIHGVWNPAWQEISNNTIINFTAPDFSAAGLPMTFGYYTSNGGPGGTVPNIDNTWGIDNFTIAINQQVPEPATLALLGVGLAGLGFSRRKQ